MDKKLKTSISTVDSYLILLRLYYNPPTSWLLQLVPFAAHLAGQMQAENQLQVLWEPNMQHVDRG